MAVVGRFLCRAIVRRRRVRAARIIAGALGAFTNSNVIRRYVGRVRWGAHRLQAAARQRVACMTDHLDLLSRHWDRLHPPPTNPTTPNKKEKKASAAPKSPRAVTSTTKSPTAAAAATTTTKPAGGVSSESGGITRNSKRSPRKKVGGTKNKTKSDPKRQGGLSPSSKPRGKRADGGESGLISAAEDEEEEEEECEARGGSEPKREGVVDIFGEAKKEEIVAWLRRARSKHSQERIIYERFTVFPLMVELLLQHEGETYRNRLQAIERVTSLRAHGQLSRTWIDEGYYAKMAHVIPPPQRMPRLFSREDGDAMFERATAKAAATSGGPVASM